MQRIVVQKILFLRKEKNWRYLPLMLTTRQQVTAVAVKSGSAEDMDVVNVSEIAKLQLCSGRYCW